MEKKTQNQGRILGEGTEKLTQKQRKKKSKEN